MRVRYWVIGGVLACALHVQSQAASAPDPCPGEQRPSDLPELHYDVASIRPHTEDDGRMMFGGPPHEALVTTTGINGLNLIVNALGIHDYQLQGAPDWLLTRRFDLQAKGDDAATAALSKLSECWAYQVKVGMLERLLAERMKLTIHHESRPIVGYALVQAKNGAKLQASKVELDNEAAKKANRSVRTMVDHGTFVMTAQRMKMVWLAQQLSFNVRAPVEDKTGLPGEYDVKLRFVRDDLRADPADSVPGDAPSIFTAVQEQLGLKLEPEKVTVDVVVLDHVEPPTEN